MAETTSCPDCAEEVLAAARVCKHCGYRLAPPLEDEENKSSDQAPTAGGARRNGENAGVPNATESGTTAATVKPATGVSPDSGGAVPEPVRYASWWARAGAWLIDLGIIGGIAALTAVIAGATSRSDAETVFGLVLLGGWVVAIPTSMALLNGQTLGKAFGGIRVKRENDSEWTAGAAIAREILAKGFWIIVPLGEVFDYLWPAFHRRRQSLHDLVVHTYVVEEPDYCHRKRGLAIGVIVVLAAWAALSYAVQ